MDPITIGVIGASAVSGILQFLNSQEAQKATAAERQKMMDMVNQMQSPNYDFSQLQPDQYKVLQKYVPEQAKVVEQAAPQLVKGNDSTQQQTRQSQLDMLSQMKALAQSGEDPLTALQEAKAKQQALSSANSQNQSLQMDANRRGVANSGLSLAAQLNNNAQASQMMGMSDMQAAADAAQRRQGAMGQAAGLAGNIFNQETGIEEQNARTMNDYNNNIANRAQSVQNANVDRMNTGQLNNINMNQNAADMNVGNANKYAQMNQQNYNNLLGRQFGDQATKVGLATGQGAGRIQDINNSTNQTNTAISGLGQGVTSGLMYYGGQQNADRTASQTQRALDQNQQQLDLQKKAMQKGIS